MADTGQVLSCRNSINFNNLKSAGEIIKKREEYSN